MDGPLPIPPTGLPVRSISDWELRDKFNSGGLLGRWKSGELYDVLVDSGDPRSRIPGHPPGTLSQRFQLVHRKTNRVVAELHWYLRPDFSIGGRARNAEGLGDPDPKGLLEYHVWYRIGFIERGD